MKTLLTKQVSLFWLLLAAIFLPALAIVWKLAVMDAPPSNSVLISEAPTETAQTSDGARQPAPPTLAVQIVRPTTAPLSANVLQISRPTVTETPKADPRLPTATNSSIQVYVSGAVKQPGVYALPLGSRVADAVSAAGGASQDADMERMNLAARVNDEAHVSVPHLGETPVLDTIVSAQPEASPSSQYTAQTSQPKPVPAGKVNINTATSAELQTLPGIGPVLAERIIAYRKENGPFLTVEDIMHVSGIKQGLFSKMRDHIKVTP